MAQVGKQRFIPFRLADIDGNPVTDRQLSDFDVIFLRDGEACPDTLTVAHYGEGLYFASYTPSGEGQDYLELYDPETGVRSADNELIDLSGTGGDVVNLTQDTGSVGALRATVDSPENFILYVFESQAWETGQRDPSSAIASTALDSDGDWLTSPLVLVHGTYHIVLINNAGQIHVVRPFLTV